MLIRGFGGDYFYRDGTEEIGKGAHVILGRFIDYLCDIVGLKTISYGGRTFIFRLRSGIIYNLGDEREQEKTAPVSAYFLAEVTAYFKTRMETMNARRPFEVFKHHQQLRRRRMR